MTFRFKGTEQDCEVFIPAPCDSDYPAERHLALLCAELKDAGAIDVSVHLETE